MRFLVDQPVSWQLSEELKKHGHDAIHVQAIGMAGASDEEILRRAAAEDRIVITQDTDFGTLLMRDDQPVSSVIIFRMRDGKPSTQTNFLLANLDEIHDDLIHGAIVIISETTIRVRRLS